MSTVSISKKTDKNESRGRGEKLSAALPVGDDPAKSKKRFRTHFVGYAEQHGGLTGAAPHLLFVNVPVDSPGVIGITETGLEFASLWNPLLDGGASSDRSLSDDEADFYIRHVQEHLDAEFDAMLFIAESIVQEDNRPDSLSSQVASLNDDWSDSQASTVRSGIVGRMHELGLVERERVGQRGIVYKLTEEGQTLLSSHTQHEH